MGGAWEGAALQDPELGDAPNKGKTRGLWEKAETTAWRKVLKCSEHSLKFTSGIKLPKQIGSQSPKHADLSLSLFLPVTN